MADVHSAHSASADDEAEDEGAGELWGMMGLFETPAALYTACEELRDAGYKDFDAQTPFPVHGLEKAIGIKPTKLPWFVLLGGFAGLASALLLTWYVNYDYPLNISGKRPFSYHVYIPIYFELTVLISSLTCFFGLWMICKLPMFFHPTMRHRSFPRATDDGFFVVIPATDPKYDTNSTKKLLEKLGASEIEEVYE